MITDSRDGNKRKLRLALFGTPEFAVPTLERLIAGRHEVAVVVCQPDRPRGRGRRASPAPVAERALDAKIPLIRPEHIGDREVEQELRKFAPELGLVVAFGQFIPQRIRELPSLGFLVNGHASLLPHHRGAAPIARAILEGDEVTGVSAMRVERKMDAGPVAASRAIKIGPHENAGELTERLSQLTANLLEQIIEEIIQEQVVWTPQDESRASLAPKIERDEARLIWSESAHAVARRVRAMAPSPGASTTLDGETLRVLDARVAPEPAGAPPGTARNLPTGALGIATADGWLLPRVLQRPGKRALEAAEFLRGRPISDGEVFE